MTSSELVDSYLHRLHRAARRLPADERDELLIGLGARVEQIRTQGLDPEETAAALDGLGDPEAIVTDALGLPTQARFRPRMVVWTLSVAWLAFLVALVLGFALRSPGGLPVYMAAGSIIQLAGLVVLVLSLVGTMWHRWRDTLATLSVVVLANSVSAVMLAALGSNSECDQSGTLVPCAATTGGLVLRGILAAVLTAAVLGTAHWVDQLRQLGGRSPARLSRAAIVGIGVGAVALFAATYVAAGQVGPADNVTGHVVNDTGHVVRVTVCPKQNCTGEPTKELAEGDHIDLPASSADIPDSVVIEADGRPTVCLLSMPLPAAQDPARFTGSFDMSISREADVQACGVDLESLHNP